MFYFYILPVASYWGMLGITLLLRMPYLHLLHFGFRSTVPAYYYVVIVTCSRYRSCTGRSVQVAGRTGPRVLCADTRVQ